MNPRVIGLATVVVVTALLPLAASAGPAGGPGARSGPDATYRPAVQRTAPPEAPPAALQEAENAGTAAVEHCGPALTSRDGIEAPTCVLTENGDTWGRTYYRNASGGKLSSVLSLMGPGGRTVQSHCPVEDGDEPGSCETPRERTAGKPARYRAVAEFAGSADGTGPLLLRSGSNSTATSAG
ncbi:hypothetical protein [Streptomyces sp. NP-1717]|uniref:hypothetical protein n=1 Tax=Streptomyces sp. NP-1717 TaxID=2704470 RepID=UPI001F5D8D04|nr:hypothetical protein [Streptomyces sp. NP-1717]MCI3226069.1 hypothetical protein [Streptomyces sp. NP-1717]